MHPDRPCDADAFGRLVSQGTDIDIGAECIAAHQFAVIATKFLGTVAGTLNAQDAAVLLPALVMFRRAKDEELVLDRSSQWARMPSNTPVP